MADSPPPLKRRRSTRLHSKVNHNESSPLVVFAHGAGAPSSSDWMIRWKEMLQKALCAVEVVTFDYPYLSGGKKRPPPKAEKLVDFHAEMVEKAVAKYPGHPLVLVGKSMGSRVSCMVACQKNISASAVVCLGYPLKGMKGAIRDEILTELTVPIMFVQGSNDGLCPLNMLEAVCRNITALNNLYVIDGGDHSFKVSQKHLLATGSTQNEVEESAVKSITSFVSRCLCQRG
ncbi:uncharacterized protein LOC141653648 [Silene latifolia]|uniref:uncharacterized protein LOC141653648 n=1 Tax=Silene latifolia TaxID=37657 RepID=UPI003D783BA7